jgi:type III restriction enzyme
VSETPKELPFDQDRVEAIASALDLREPNRDALESIVFEIGRHYVIYKMEPPFRGVCSSATGVGKTYVLAATIEYFAAEGVRNFAVITPGKTILNKTKDNFSPGGVKSLLGGMEVEPVVITSDNFNSPAMREAMDDESKVKLYIFTVQALTKPATKQGKKVHKFQEGLGEAFYGHLQATDDLFVVADEQHFYFGKKFAQAIKDLEPWAVIGLTATPHPKTPKDEIIFSYPLAAAIADKLVKVPVLVGRKDDLDNPRQKLADGLELLERKAEVILRYCAENEDKEPITPLMLVIAPNIEEADEIEAIFKDPDFFGGAYGERVLTVHSDKSDEALAELEELEEPKSPYSVVVSVGMLKEGWDNRCVYVLASLRASVAKILTEQTLGRGLRLPWGQYTGYELLDSLEVLGHERYEQLLKNAGALTKAEFIDRRTRAVLGPKNAEGIQVPVSKTIEGGQVVPLVSDIEGRTKEANQELEDLAIELRPKPEFGPLQIPQLKMTAPNNDFSLADISDYGPFRKLGESIAVDPTGELRRLALNARIVTGSDGVRQTELEPTVGVDVIVSEGEKRPLNEVREELMEAILAAPVVPARAGERESAKPIADAFVKGLGKDAAKLLSAYMSRAAGGLIKEIGQEAKDNAPRPNYKRVVEVTTFDKVRNGKAKTTKNTIKFQRGVGVQGLTKSLYTQDWFDSGTELKLANILDGATQITYWVRLQVGDLPILWGGAGRDYNPDFIAVEGKKQHYLIEVKADIDLEDEAVVEKASAARRWANYCSTDAKVKKTAKWDYLLVGESDIKTAKGSWAALKKLGR